ncbi:hypothetical protein CDD81_1648 [Ophiocordyceps australis]|uniref:Uncharacterized protein n=1 Tax=Ophiocordyceps australis TaxID=1399860 RepID=A0A2C5XYD0_9HYPO|nr:hypothetical protein CDD81_1648 [Ophiocordyceps australis]
MMQHSTPYGAVAALGHATSPYDQGALVPYPQHGNSQPPAQQRPMTLERRTTDEVTVSDIRDAHMTEPKARQRLSSYIVMRMEKSTNRYEVDAEGYQLPPTWQVVDRVEETDISQQEATRKVNQLNRDTSPVRDKKSKLGRAVQRQLEKAQHDLEREEPDPRYQYVLAQLESKVKEIEDGSPLLYLKSNNEYKPRSRSRSRSRSKRPLERVSVTAYFQRTPKENESAVSMLHEKSLVKKRQQQLQTQPDGWSVAAQPRHSAPSLMPLPLPLAQPVLVPPRPQVQRRPTDICVTRHYSHKGQGRHSDDKKQRGPEIKVTVGSARQSHGSLTSEDMYDSDLYSDYETPESSNGSSSRRGRGPTQSRRERRQHFGRDKSPRCVASLAVGLPPVPMIPSEPRPLAQGSIGADMLQLAYEEGHEKGSRDGQTRPGIRRLESHEARRKIFGSRVDEFQENLHRRRGQDVGCWYPQDDNRDRKRLTMGDEDENLCYGDEFLENPFALMGKRPASRPIPRRPR